MVNLKMTPEQLKEKAIADHNRSSIVKNSEIYNNSNRSKNENMENLMQMGVPNSSNFNQEKIQREKDFSRERSTDIQNENSLFYKDPFEVANNSHQFGTMPTYDPNQTP